MLGKSLSSFLKAPFHKFLRIEHDVSIPGEEIWASHAHKTIHLMQTATIFSVHSF